MLVTFHQAAHLKGKSGPGKDYSRGTHEVPDDHIACKHFHSLVKAGLVVDGEAAKAVAPVSLQERQKRLAEKLSKPSGKLPSAQPPEAPAAVASAPEAPADEPPASEGEAEEAGPDSEDESGDAPEEESASENKSEGLSRSEEQSSKKNKHSKKR